LVGYYDAFPPKSTDVVIETRENRQVVVAAKDFAAGEVIYKVSRIVLRENQKRMLTDLTCRKIPLSRLLMPIFKQRALTVPIVSVTSNLT
jgi:hypothetical protein